jgi:hypothetical protein
MLLLENKKYEVEFIKAEKVMKHKICPLSGKLAAEHCPGTIEDVFIEGTEPKEYCSIHTASNMPQDSLSFRPKVFKIAFPKDRDVFKMDPILRQEYQRITLKASIPRDMEVDRVEWRVNDHKIGDSSYPFCLYWNLRPGIYTIKAIAIEGNQKQESSSVEIKVEE